MKKATLLMVITFLSSLTIANAQLTVYYQPTPFPNTVDLIGDDGSYIHHIVDGWLTNIYYSQSFIRDGRLQVGGWGDIYHTYLKFDLEGLPANITQAKLWLKSFDRGDNSTTTPFAFARAAGSWDENMTWTTQPPIGPFVSYSPGPIDYWWIIDITSWYQAWQQGTVANNGITMSPWYNDNRFNMFRSSRYGTSSERPKLQLTFNQPVTTPNFRMPLPGGVAWLVTTEVGGWDCRGNYDEFHDDTNYFSIDFSWRNVDPDTLNQVYSSTDDIPVIAAASGRVTYAGYSSANGYHVVLDHDSDNDAKTGFSTRYLHLKQQPSVSTGNSVNQGDLLGYMGNTGISFGTHLHFGVRYNNNGASSQNQLRYTVMDGRLLKSYQTACEDNSASGDYIHYYNSSNRAY